MVNQNDPIILQTMIFEMQHTIGVQFAQICQLKAIIQKLQSDLGSQDEKENPRKTRESK